VEREGAQAAARNIVKRGAIAAAADRVAAALAEQEVLLMPPLLAFCI